MILCLTQFRDTQGIELAERIRMRPMMKIVDGTLDHTFFRVLLVVPRPSRRNLSIQGSLTLPTD